MAEKTAGENIDNDNNVIVILQYKSQMNDIIISVPSISYCRQSYFPRNSIYEKSV